MMIKFIEDVLDLLIPRFITEDVAAIYTENGIQPICSLKYLEEGMEYDCIATIKTFNFFGFGLFPTFVEYKEK